MGLHIMDGDDAFYYLHKDRELKGAVQTHFDDFSLAGTPEFIQMIIHGVSRKLTTSQV